MPRKMFKGVPQLRVEYRPGTVPKVINVETGVELGGVRAAVVQLLPDEVIVNLDVSAEVFVETTNVGVMSEEFEALVELARFVANNALLPSPELKAKIELVEHLLHGTENVLAHGGAAHAASDHE